MGRAVIGRLPIWRLIAAISRLQKLFALLSRLNSWMLWLWSWIGLDWHNAVSILWLVEIVDATEIQV